MPPSSGTKRSVRDFTLILFQLLESESGQLKAEVNRYSHEIKGKKRDVVEEKEEKPCANPSSASLNWKHEINDGTAQHESDSEFIVWWDESDDQDSENSMNWSFTKKWVNIFVISIISFLVWVAYMSTDSLLEKQFNLNRSLVSSMLAPGVQLVMKDFNTSSTTFATFVVSIFVLGFACEPLLLASLSELYGRVIIYNITNVLFLSFIILCAVSQNQSMLLAFRFLSGFTGVATITIGSGTIADIMSREKRDKTVSVWSVGSILDPPLGPIIGDYVAEVADWRWMFWVISIAIDVVTVFAFFVLRETYPVVLLKRKAARLRKETGNHIYRSKLASDLTPKELFKHSIVRPLKMLIYYPIVTAMCTYVAVLYDILYLLFATYSFIYREVYGFSTSAAGLVFLADGIGTLLGLFYVGSFSDRTLKNRAAAGKTITPEDRLPPIITIPGSLAFPIGLFVYGWSAQEHVYWIIPQIETAITDFGSILIFIDIQTYLVDAFVKYAVSVIDVNAVLRGTAEALISLGGLNMYNALEWGWENTLLSFIALAFAPMPWVFALYDAKIRNFKSSQIKL